MAETLNQRLNRAYELIEADRHSEARAELEALLTKNRENPDVWWVYAHALDDPDRAEDALQQVLRLDPNYPGARDLTSVLLSTKSGVPATPVDESLDELDVDAFLSDEDSTRELHGNEGDDLDEEAEAEPLGRRSLAFGALLVLAIVLGLFLVFIVLNPFGGDDEDTEDEPGVAGVGDATATSVEEGTPVPTVEVAVDETLVFPTSTVPEQTELPGGSPDFDALYAALSDVEVIEDSAEVTQTDFGSTLIVAVCSEAGAGLRSTIDAAMSALAFAVAEDAGDTDAAGVRFTNCDDNTILNVIAVPIEQAVAFANGDIAESEYRSTWRPVG